MIGNRPPKFAEFQFILVRIIISSSKPDLVGVAYMVGDLERRRDMAVRYLPTEWR